MHEPHRPVIAAFDFDGTLTRRDTLLPFLRFLCGPRALARSLLRHSLSLGTAVTFDRPAQRDGVKEGVLRELLAGRPRDDVQAAGEHFARRLGKGPPGMRLRPAPLSRWHWHREQGHDIVIVSAALDAYVAPFAQALGGGAAVLATRLLVAEDGTLTGGLEGLNCRGAEKVRRLRDWNPRPDAELWAYGNSSGDRELLAAAHVGHRVGPGGRIMQAHTRRNEASHAD